MREKQYHPRVNQDDDPETTQDTYRTVKAELFSLLSLDI